jgi:hypothetical protein
MVVGGDQPSVIWRSTAPASPSRWKAQTVTDFKVYGQYHGFQDVECPGTSLCVIGAGSRYLALHNPRTIERTPALYAVQGGRYISSLTCSTTKMCAMLTSVNPSFKSVPKVAMISRADLSQPRPAWQSVRSLRLQNLSCASATFCFGLSSDGYQNTLHTTTSDPLTAPAEWTSATTEMWSTAAVCLNPTVCVIAAGGYYQGQNWPSVFVVGPTALTAPSVQ